MSTETAFILLVCLLCICALFVIEIIRVLGF